MLDKRSFYINGKWVEPFKKKDFTLLSASLEISLIPVFNPKSSAGKATGSAIRAVVGS